MKKIFVDLLNRMKKQPNHISPSVYDTAWAAWLYPQALQWVVEAQHPDGSWGAEVEYYYDRVICTLSAINAIAATSNNKHHLKRIEYGISYLEKAIPHLKNGVFETIGFELIVPNLVNIAASYGLNVSYIQTLIEPIIHLCHKKLALLPPELIYSPDIIAAHSLEFIPFEDLDKQAVSKVRIFNGSIQNSSSATVFVEIALQGTVEGRAYLDILMERYNNTLPGFAPLELFEGIWALHQISLNVDLDTLRPTIDPFVQLLSNMWTDKGVGFSATILPDLDDTALGLRLLDKLNMSPRPNALKHYEQNSHFQCFPYERNISLDVHTHLIHALKNMQDFPNQADMLLKALNILGRYLTTEYIVDKWHISPYYSTSHVITALTGLSDNIITKQINWLLNTQQANGSWTFYPAYPKAAIEETAHVLMALMSVYEQKRNIPFKVIEKGYRYLISHYTCAEDLPALWIHKSLYNPYHIVDASILSAMVKFENLNNC